MASNSKQSKLDETKFTEAETDWNLEKLYEDLRAVKQKGGSEKLKTLTKIEKCHLRGLLCGYRPEEIANERGVVPGTVNDALSKTLYCYIKELLNNDEVIRHWSDVPDFLEKAGYKIQASEQPQPSQPFSGKQENTLEASKQINEYLIQDRSSSIRQSFFKLSSQNSLDWLGAVLSLQEIASRDHCPPDDSWRIMICLAAFIREKAPRKKEEEGKEKRSFKRLPDYIQVALTVIGLRDKKDRRILDLRNLDIRGANLDRANLQRVDFSGTNLQRSSLQGANLQRANLLKANLQRANLSQANLQKANLYRANLQKADLSQANLQWVSSSHTNLQSANFYKTNLKEAFLWKANLKKASLLEADLNGAFLGEVDFTGAKKLTSSQVESAQGDDKTFLPNNLEPPIHWAQPSSTKITLKKLFAHDPARLTELIKLEMQKRSSST